MRMSTEDFRKLAAGKSNYDDIELPKFGKTKVERAEEELARVIPIKKKSKYRNVPTYVGDIRFDSKKEAARYEELVNLYRAGIVKTVLRQVPFDLPGGIKYRADFQVLYNDGTYVFEDVKGYRTKMYKMKKAQVEALHKIEIKEV